MFAGNGTLNKHAGIDYKQLSLVAKINENHSGEVFRFSSFLLFQCGCSDIADWMNSVQICVCINAKLFCVVC